jgi:hypothetical protein
MTKINIMTIETAANEFTFPATSDLVPHPDCFLGWGQKKRSAGWRSKLRDSRTPWGPRPTGWEKLHYSSRVTSVNIAFLISLPNFIKLLNAQNQNNQNLHIWRRSSCVSVVFWIMKQTWHHFPGTCNRYFTMLLNMSQQNFYVTSRCLEFKLKSSSGIKWMSQCYHILYKADRTKAK